MLVRIPFPLYPAENIKKALDIKGKDCHLRGSSWARNVRSLSHLPFFHVGMLVEKKCIFDTILSEVSKLDRNREIWVAFVERKYCIPLGSTLIIPQITS